MKRYIKLQLFMLLLLILSSCMDDNNQLEFDVFVEDRNYQVGDTVEFKLSGNADFISFFSGEKGARYDCFQRVEAAGIPELSFNSLRANGSQEESLHVMLSKDFAGVSKDTLTTKNNIRNARWIDITNRMTLSDGSLTTSGLINLSEFSDSSVVIAFKYTASSGSVQNKWTISNLRLTNTIPQEGVEYLILNHSSGTIPNYGFDTPNPGWVAFSMTNNYKWTTSSTYMAVSGATTQQTATSDVESWIFSGPVNLKKVTPDLGKSIQNMTTRLSRYAYVYEKPGTYKATFVGSVNSVHDMMIKERTIEVVISE